MAGDQDTAIITQTGASFIVKPAVRPIIQEKAPPPEAGSSASKLSKGGAVRARSTGRGARRNLKKFPMGPSRSHRRQGQHAKNGAPTKRGSKAVQGCPGRG